jgi:hypothetical protein
MINVCESYSPLSLVAFSILFLYALSVSVALYLFSVTTNTKHSMENRNVITKKSDITHEALVTRAPSYRFEEENTKRTSSELTRRGQRWSRHASWNLPMAPRHVNNVTNVREHGLEQIMAILTEFKVDPIRGFLPHHDPLQRLPYARYHLWEDLGDDLPKLLGARLGQARAPLRKLPMLSTDKLVTEGELRRAHLLLCLFAHAYVWGGTSPYDTIPEGL